MNMIRFWFFANGFGALKETQRNNEDDNPKHTVGITREHRARPGQTPSLNPDNKLWWIFSIPCPPSDPGELRTVGTREMRPK